MASTASPSPGLRTITLATLSAAAFMSSATIRVGDPLIPQIADDLRVSVGAAGLVTTAFALAYGMCQLMHGPVGDRLGKFRMIAFATLLSAFGTAAVALADSLTSLSVLRFASGITASAIIPLGMAFVGDSVPYAERQAVLARFLTGQILGTVFGQAAGGLLGEFLHWRAIFLVLGAMYFIAGLAMLAEWRSGRIVDRRGDASLRPLEILRRYAAIAGRANARLVLATVFCEAVLFFGGFTYFGAYLRERFAVDYASIGLIVACFGIGGIVYTLSARRLLPHLGERGFAIAGGALLCAAFLGALFATPKIGFALVSTLSGIGFYLLHGTLQTRATQMAPESRGMAVAIFASCLFIGASLGVALGGLIVETLGYATMFVVSALGLLALSLVFARKLSVPTP
jgi:predicted MFS family arabinose efflux permease